MDDEGIGLVQHFQKGVCRALKLEMLLEKKGFSRQLHLEVRLSPGLKLESPKQIVGYERCCIVGTHLTLFNSEFPKHSGTDLGKAEIGQKC